MIRAGALGLVLVLLGACGVKAPPRPPLPPAAPAPAAEPPAQGGEKRP